MRLLRNKKCVNCGFLGLVPISHLKSIPDLDWETAEEVPPHWREDLQYITAENVPTSLGCYRRQFDQLKCVDMDLGDRLSDNDVKSLTATRNCKFFYKYHPGYSPSEHKELLRDDLDRRSGFRSNFISAIIGAVFATVVNIIWNLLTS